MVIELSTTFAIRCGMCSSLELYQLNIFDLSGDKNCDIFCKCGSQLLSITRKGSKYLSIKYYCIICDLEHTVLIPNSIFWTKNRVNSLLCLETGLNLGYYGSYTKLQRELDRQQKELDLMANDLGFADFVNPEIILEVLDFIHDMAELGVLFCECGCSDLNIELFFDSLELTCNNCNSAIIIPAANKNHLNKLKKMNEVVIKLNTPPDIKPKIIY